MGIICFSSNARQYNTAYSELCMDNFIFKTFFIYYYTAFLPASVQWLVITVKRKAEILKTFENIQLQPQTRRSYRKSACQMMASVDIDGRLIWQVGKYFSTSFVFSTFALQVQCPEKSFYCLTVDGKDHEGICTELTHTNVHEHKLAI